MNKFTKRVSLSVLLAGMLGFTFMASNFGRADAMFNAETFAGEFAARSADSTAPEPAAAGTYNIDPAHSTIGFSARHLVINDVPGRFREFGGTIQYDPENITQSSVTFTAKSASVDTGVERRDQHLRSADFFDVARFPEITFKSTKIEKKSKDELIAHGDFTLHGVTKQIALPFKLYGTIKDPWGNTRFGVEARLTINRQDYGIAWSQTLDNGSLVVSNDIRIVLLIEAVKPEPKPQTPKSN